MNISPEDRSQWEDFGKTLAEKSKSFKQRRDGTRDSTIANQPSTTPSIETFFPNYNYCQQIKWNVINEDFTALILTVTWESNEHICSLSNAESSIAYHHLCQYGSFN